MKKTFVLGLSAIMVLASSATAFANISESNAEINNQESSHVEVATPGTGSCRHGGCKCSSYVKLQGGAGKCVCGHWDYVHN